MLALAQPLLIKIVAALLIFFVGKWLENYAYRTPVVWWVFVVPVVLILLLALATIGAQTAKAAFKNPVDSLKCE